MMMQLINSIGAFIVCSMCSVRFNGKKNDILIAGVIGFMACFMMSFFKDLYVRAFVSGLTYSILSEIFSRITKKPVAVYLAAVLVPFVPGKLTFYMMGEFVHGDRLASLDRLSEIVCVCGMIALAILLTETVIKFWQTKIKKVPEEDSNW